MTTTHTLVLLLFLPALVLAQDPEPYAEAIDQKSLKDNLSIIASDALEGRFTGSRGQKMAAAFIADHFQRLGLKAINKGSYYQPFSLYSYKQNEISITTSTTKFSTSNDVVFYGTRDSGGPNILEVVFAGAATEEDLAQISIRDRVVLIISPSLSPIELGPKINSLTSRGALGVMMYSTAEEVEYKTFMEQMQSTLTEGSMSPDRQSPEGPQLYIVSKAVVESLFGKLDKMKSVKKMKPAKATFVTRVSEEVVRTENVMGFLEGGDKKDEVLLITAHYDHIGLASGTGGDWVNNGADDDGSGTVSVLQLATAFAKAKSEGHGPRRSILFMTVSAEELGLFGSAHYADVDPVIPLSKTVADLNIDMIGRWDRQHAGKAPYVYVIGADKLSSELQAISVGNNEKYTKLEFDYTYNDENHPEHLYQRSDHWNFARHGIPIIFYFDGIHEDYHRASDEVGKIDFDLMVTRARCVFYTAWEIANRNDRLKVDK